MSKDYDVILGFHGTEFSEEILYELLMSISFWSLTNRILILTQDDNPPQNTCHPCSFADTGEHNTVLANELQAEVYWKFLKNIFFSDKKELEPWSLYPVSCFCSFFLSLKAWYLEF